MLPPSNYPVRPLAAETGITDSTLYTWRKVAMKQGVIVSGSKKSSAKWSSEEKFSIVFETAALNEIELSEYCRKKGLYPEQVVEWKATCMQAFDTTKTSQKKLAEEQKKNKKRIQSLTRELNRKDKALAEAAALLVLAKKAQAIWGEPEGD